MTWLIYALLSAVFFGLRGILYQWSSKHGYERNLMLFGVFASGAIVSLISLLLFQQQWSMAALVGIMMGIFSFAANASMFKGFSVGKASLIAILTAMPPVLVALLAYIVWKETLSTMQLAAFAVILIGIILIRYSNDLSLKNLQGAQWGLLAMLFFSLNDMTGKLSTMLDAALFPTIFCMFATGAACFGISWRIDQDRRKRRALLDPAMSEKELQGMKSAPRTFGWGLVVGLTNVFGMILIISAFRDGLTGLVSAVASLNVLLILLYTRIFLREKFSPMELTGMAAAVSGVLLLRLFQ